MLENKIKGKNYNTGRWLHCTNNSKYVAQLMNWNLESENFENKK